LEPKKHKELYSTVAEKLNVSEKLVSDCVEFYYEEVKKTLSSMEYPRVNVLNLGIFKSKPETIRKVIKKYNEMIPKFNPETIRGFEIIKDLTNKVKKLEDNLAKWEIEWERKRVHKEKRTQYELEKNLGKQE
jgi:nucleoid DNA-binding protein